MQARSWRRVEKKRHELHGRFGRLRTRAFERRLHSGRPRAPRRSRPRLLSAEKLLPCNGFDMVIRCRLARADNGFRLTLGYLADQPRRAALENRLPVAG